MALSHRLPFLPKVPKGLLRQLEFRERKNWLWSTLLSAFCSLDLNINWPCYWLSAMLLAGLSVSRHRDIFPFFFFTFLSQEDQSYFPPPWCCIIHCQRRKMSERTTLKFYSWDFSTKLLMFYILLLFYFLHLIRDLQSTLHN